jgi:hypothetical protein
MKEVAALVSVSIRLADVSYTATQTWISTDLEGPTTFEAAYPF